MAKKFFYPDNLDSPNLEFNKIVFTTRDSKATGWEPYVIALPTPPSISVNDGGEYGTLDITGESFGLKEATLIASGSDKLAKIGTILMNKIKPKGLKEGAMFATKRVTSPNTNTTFEKNTLRTYDMNFRMVPKSMGEANNIRDIWRAFQKFIYAAPSDGDEASVILEYPPVWDIRFYNGSTQSAYMPKLFGCYLKSVTSNFNPTEAIFHRDGSPVEFSIDLTFQESRVLTRADIGNLYSKDVRGIDGETSRASL